MRKPLFLLVAIILSQSFEVSAQINNADFEDWYTDTVSSISTLNGWEHLNPGGTSNTVLFGTYRDSASQHNIYSLRLSRWYHYAWDEIRQTAATGFKPDSLSGYYKYTEPVLAGPRSTDTAYISIYLHRWDNAIQARDTVGKGYLELTEQVNFTAFSCPITYSSTAAPDSFTIILSPSKFWQQGGGCKDSNYCSYLNVDNLELKQKTNGIEQASGPVARIYPNPARDLIHIQFDKALAGDATLKVVNAIGITVKSTVLAAGTSYSLLDISQLPEGLYTIHTTNRDGSVGALQKLVVH